MAGRTQVERLKMRKISLVEDDEAWTTKTFAICFMQMCRKVAARPSWIARRTMKRERWLFPKNPSDQDDTEKERTDGTRNKQIETQHYYDVTVGSFCRKSTLFSYLFQGIMQCCPFENTFTHFGSEMTDTGYVSFSLFRIAPPTCPEFATLTLSKKPHRTIESEGPNFVTILPFSIVPTMMAILLQASGVSAVP